jgi:hypothetical protein
MFSMRLRGANASALLPELFVAPLLCHSGRFGARFGFSDASRNTLFGSDFGQNSTDEYAIENRLVIRHPASVSF